MRRPGRSAEDMQGLIVALDDAVALLGEFSVRGDLVPVAENPGTLLDQCLALCAQADAAGPDPVRTLHHFACTGGTLISKCLAAMPNTQLLSEVDPLSTVQDDAGKSRFAPTDMIGLLRQSTRGTREELLIDVFLGELELVHAETVRLGQRLVLRDHAHGHYCHGPAIPARPGLRAIVARRFAVESAVTVRHPLDSYLALLNNGWMNYTPTGLDEYCRRYRVFLDDHAGLPVMRYEDFIDSPQDRLREICRHLQLPYADEFIDLFDVFTLSGGSGRAGNVIAHRPRRPITGTLAEEMDLSTHYSLLCQQLQYER